MKTLITLFSTVFLFTQLQAQISEDAVTLSLGEQNAFVVEHPGANKKMVTKIMEKALKEYGKVKRNKKAKEWNCLQCSVPGISGETNVYFKIREGKGMITSYVAYDDGTQFISSANSPEAADRISKQLTFVGYDVTRAVISNELKNEEKSLKDRNKEQEKLEKKNKDLHNDIADYEKKIKEAEAAIEKNLQEQEDKKMEIEKQINVVEEVTDRLNNVGKN